MSRTVYLHVGEPKSGTTFLQQVMWGNRAALAQQGVVLPGLTGQDHFRAAQDLRDVPQRADDPAGPYRGEWELLARQATTGGRIAVISHELLAAATREQAGSALASLRGAEVHVVLTVRDFVSLLPAEWQETVKHGSTMGWQPWIRRVMSGEDPDAPQHRRWFWRVHDTLEVLERWSHALPPDRVHVVTVPQPGAPPRLLWDRFAAVLGADRADVDLSTARPNASLGLTETEMLRRLNAELRRDGVPDWFYAVHVKEQLAHRVLAARTAGMRPGLNARQSSWARGRADIVVAQLKSSGYDIVGTLDDLLPADDAEPAGAMPEDIPADALLAAALESLAAVLHNQYENVVDEAGRFRFARAARVRRMLRNVSGRHPGIARFVRRASELRTGQRDRRVP